MKTYEIVISFAAEDDAKAEDYLDSLRNSLFNHGDVWVDNVELSVVTIKRKTKVIATT